jgi:Methyltransferase domain
MRFNSWAKQFVPAGIQDRVRGSTWWTRYQAQKLARGSRRLDLCAAQFAQLMLSCPIASLEGKVCLELGCGWVLSHALTMHLLGASRVIATDLTPIAQPRFLRDTIQASVSSFVRDSLAPFCEQGAVRQRWNHVRKIQHWDLEVLHSLGIEYLAPMDFAAQPYLPPVDFIFSNSVLEHIFVRQVPDAIRNLSQSLVPGGEMYHSDFEHHPFDFLGEPAVAYGDAEQSDRGNRLRYSRWLQVFSAIDGLDTRVVHRWQREDVAIPSRIDRSVEYTDEADLKTSHLCFLSRRVLANRTLD